jgi:hypothetical protein
VSRISEKIAVELNFKTFPDKYTCDGVDISPEIRISGVKYGKSIAIIMDDPDTPMGTFTHWLV